MKKYSKGLSEKEAIESRKKYGSNALASKKTETFWHKLAGNFKDPLIVVLCVALGVISVLAVFQLTEWYEVISVFIAIILAVFVSTLFEFRNESSFQELQEEASRIKSNVFRNGHIADVFHFDIVIDDHVLLQSGDKVPADGKLVSGSVKVSQASLTGEPEGLEKTIAPDGYSPKHIDLLDKHIVFRGSVVEDGEAIMLVETIGDKTFYGSLAKELSEAKDRLSPLQVKLNGLAKSISRFAYIGAIVIALIFIFNKVVVANNFELGMILSYVSNWEVFLLDVMNAFVLSIVIIVASVPEGLPMMIAIVLSVNMIKLLKEKVLVRKLLGIETAGSLNMIFLDKTGTITKGNLQAVTFFTGDNNKYNSHASIPEKLEDILSFSILQNTSCVQSAEGEIFGGNLTDKAIVSFIDGDDRTKMADKEVVLEKNILFNSFRKFSASQLTKPDILSGIDGASSTLIKGAFEIVLETCSYYFDADGNKKEIGDKELVKQYIRENSDPDIRLIAFAVSENIIEDENAIPQGTILIGILAMRDEIREESAYSAEMAKNANIQVVMITGDRLDTATTIARKIGLLQNEYDVVMTSTELNEKSDEELIKLLPRLRVVARALPTDKSRLVKLVMSENMVVGMTGDGVNDSPAIKHADVGFAMGSGTEVSKEASDIVILDDNFKSIISAVYYGRTIFKNIRKFVVFQLTINIAAVFTIFLGNLLGYEFPLTIIQILWINIIMDTLAALAFSGEAPVERYMQEEPANRDENIITKKMLTAIVFGGLYITALSVLFLTLSPLKEFFVRDGVLSTPVFLTAFFNLFVFSCIINMFNVRTETMRLFEKISDNKGFLQVFALIVVLQLVFTYFGGEILRTTQLQLKEWLLVIGMALTIVPADLLRKYFSIK